MLLFFMENASFRNNFYGGYIYLILTKAAISSQAPFPPVENHCGDLFGLLFIFALIHL